MTTTSELSITEVNEKLVISLTIIVVDYIYTSIEGKCESKMSHGDNCAVKTLAIYKDGKIVSGSVDGIIKVWKNKNCVCTLHANFDVSGLLVMKNTIVAGGDDCVVKA